MKNFLLNHKKILIPVVLILLTLPTFSSMIRPGYFFMQDDLQDFRIFEMNKCFQDFQFPCRWVPDMGYQYGYPQFNYYGPSVYYLGELIHLTGVQYIDTVKIMFALGYILSTLLMFYFLRDFLNESSAFFGALLYSYTPYKAVEVYVRGDMNEFWSLVIFPLIFWMILKLVRTGRKKYVALTGVSVGLLLITHNLMTFIFLPLAGVWALALIYTEKKWQLLFKVVLGFLLGLVLAGFFTLPVLFEQKYAHLETLLGGYFGYEQHFATLRELFFSNQWGYGSSVLGPVDDLSLSTGIVQWIASFGAVVLALLTFKKNKKLSVLALVLAVLSAGVLFLTHERSMFIWKMIPQFAYLQFPWRFLTDSIFLLAILPAVGIYLIGKNFNVKLAYILGGISVIAVILLHASFFQPKDWQNISDVERFSGVKWQKDLTISIFDYLPIYAKFPPIHAAPDVPEILDGTGNFVNYFKGSNFQQGLVNIEKGAEIRLPLFDFPGMRVWVDGKEVPHINSDCRFEDFCLGLIAFNVTPGQHQIKAQLTNTPVRTIGNGLTILGILVVLGLLWKGKKDEKISD